MKRYGKQFLIIYLVVLTGLLGACQARSQDTEQLDEVQQQLAEVESRLDQFAGAAEASEAPVFEVTIATYILDTAGFHAMDESINEDGTIDPQFLSTVTRVGRVLAATPWPAEMQEDVAALRETLDTLATALENDDVEAAGPAAADAHEQQHDLSNTVSDWLAAQDIGEQSEHDQ